MIQFPKGYLLSLPDTEKPRQMWCVAEVTQNVISLSLKTLKCQLWQQVAQ
jgi:hypothetical protein